MNLKLLIDGVVRQMTVFVAQLSTASGVLELARELVPQHLHGTLETGS